MQKKLLALAVAGALAPAAAMAQSTVEIYGRANLGIDSWKATGATAGSAQDFKSRTRIYDSGSRVGFRVNEGLGGGMRAFVVIETGVNIDNGSTTGQSGAANASTATWASRDSYVGIGGDSWGDVRFGRQSIWWANGVIAQTAANYVNTFPDSIINSPGAMSAPVTRQSNVVSYNTPTWGGFNASVSYSPNSENAAANTNTDAKVYGLTGRYTGGPFRAQLDWAKNWGTSPTAAGATRAEKDGLKFGVGWAYAPGSQISGIIGRLSQDNAAALVAGTGLTAVTIANAGDSTKQNFWLLNWEHMIGPWQLLAQYYQNGKVTGGGTGTTSSDTRTKSWGVGAKYYLSKRTGVYLTYTQVRNENNAWADYAGAGYSSAGAGGIPSTAAGADPTVWALGIMHNF